MLSSLFIRCVYFHGPCQLALSNSGLAPSCADATSSNVFVWFLLISLCYRTTRPLKVYVNYTKTYIPALKRFMKGR